LPKEVIEEMDKKAFQEYLENDKNFKKCPCGEYVEIRQGEVNL